MELTGVKFFLGSQGGWGIDDMVYFSVVVELRFIVVISG